MMDSSVEEIRPRSFDLAIEAVTEDSLYALAKLYNEFKQIRVNGLDLSDITLDNVDEAVLNRAFDIHLQGVL